jgi:hypothetical protein
MAGEDKTVKEMSDAIKRFLAESWCIDGDCEMVGSVKVIGQDGNAMDGMQYTLTDSIRGKFHITVSHNG